MDDPPALATGTTPTGYSTGGEHCSFIWQFEIDSATNTFLPSPSSDTIGFCYDHSKYKYASVMGSTMRDAEYPNCALLADGIELVKEVDTTCRMHRVKHEPQLAGCLTHELGDQPIEDDREKRQMKLAGQCRGGHRLAGSRRADQKKFAPRNQTVFAQVCLLTLLAKYAPQASAQAIR